MERIADTVEVPPRAVGLRQVSGQVTQSMLVAADTMDWPYPLDLDAHGIGADSPLRSNATWVSWSEYLTLLRALTGGTETPEAYVACGVLSMAHSAHGPFRHLGALVGGTQALYQATFGWVMTTLLPQVRMELSERAPGKLHIEVELGDDLPPSEPFFYTLKGTMTALPRALGRPDAIVEVDIRGHAASYEVTLPSRGGLWTRIKRGWRTVLDQHAYDRAYVRLRENVTGLVDDLRRVNRQLVDSQAQWQSLAEGIPGVVLVAGTTGAPRGPFGAEAPAPEVLEAIVAAFRAAEVMGAVLDRGELARFEVVGGDGDGLWAWACRASRLPGSDQAVLVAVDDTERIRAQRALRDTEQRMLQAQKMEALGRLAGGLAHDLNNLFAALLGHAELLQLRHGDDPETAEHVDGIIGVVDDASALTRQLLLYARNRPAQVTTVDLADVIGHHQGMYTRLIGDDVRLSIELASEHLWVQADASQLQQVVLNLLVNARDAMPDGGSIALRTRIIAAEGAEWVELEVTDDGHGMDDAILDRAMEPFFTTKDVGRGTGLGLSTVYWIAERAGGTVAIDSQRGQGTRVRVRLPRAAPREAAAARPTQPRAATTGASVLLVEDDAAVRLLTAAMLESLGYRVVACTDAAHARRVLDEADTAPDLLLTDITMPGESGVSLANHLAERFPHLGIAMMSGYTTEPPELEQPHRARGRFMHKPFGLRDLGRVLGEAARASGQEARSTADVATRIE